MERDRTIIIEPDPERRAQLIHLLHASGYEATVAPDLAAALLDAVRARGDGSAERKPTLAEVDRRYAREVLRATGGNKTRAAEILGIDRKTLYRLIGAPPAPPVTPPDLEPPLRRVNGA